MSHEKTVIRYFVDFYDAQARWLNRMAERGYRLVSCGACTYSFEACSPGEYEYAVEYIGDTSHARSKEYRSFLEGMGYRTITKNINLNWSIGKMRWRPYARGTGQMATSPGAFNKELLIVEKRRDGSAFALHTSANDRCDAYRSVRRAYVWGTILSLLLIGMTFVPSASDLPNIALWIMRAVLAAFAVLLLVTTVRYIMLEGQMRRESEIYE